MTEARTPAIKASAASRAPDWKDIKSVINPTDSPVLHWKIWEFEDNRWGKILTHWPLLIQKPREITVSDHSTEKNGTVMSSLYETFSSL